jgi:hypothetical protein
MVGGAVEHQKNILPGKLSREDVEEDLEARRIRCRPIKSQTGTSRDSVEAMRQYWMPARCARAS